MKKLMLLVLGMILVLGAVSTANAANFASISLTVSVSSTLSISVSTDSYNFGALAPNTETVSTVINVTNDSTGYIETYYFKGYNVGTSPVIWTLGSTKGANVYTLAAGFASAAPLAGAFGAEDLLKNGSWDDATNGDKSTTLKFAITEDGASVPPAGVRHLYFRLGMPTSSSTTGPLTVTATITGSL